MVFPHCSHCSIVAAVGDCLVAETLQDAAFVEQKGSRQLEIGFGKTTHAMAALQGFQSATHDLQAEYLAQGSLRQLKGLIKRSLRIAKMRNIP